jgi:SAM-dependent methyltransferase
MGRWEKLLQDIEERGDPDLSKLVAAVASGIALTGGQPSGKLKLDVPYIPTSARAVEAMLKLADVKSTDIVYDLGCGDGRIVIHAARNMGARGVGIDIDPERIREARENAIKESVEDLVRFEENNFFDADIREATVVTIFLLEQVNPRMRPKLLADLKPGTRVVSNTFDMGEWKPDKEVTLEDTGELHNLSKRLLLWVIPERAAA